MTEPLNPFEQDVYDHVLQQLHVPLTQAQRDLMAAGIAMMPRETIEQHLQPKQPD